MSGQGTPDGAVVFACDAAYAPYALFAAHQIAALAGPAQTRGFAIVMAAAESISVPPGLAADGIEVVDAAPERFDGLILDARRSPAVYLRLALPELLVGRFRRILYLDADVFVQGGNFAGLLAADLGGLPLAAVRDNIQWRRPGRRAPVFGRLGLAPAPYFNSGALLIDVAAFRKAELLERCLDLARGAGRDLPGHDQDLLNAVLKGGWAELSPVWNWQYTRASALFEPLTDVHVIHFIGLKKPWSTRKAGYPPRFREAYRAFFETHLPGAAPPEPDPPGPLADPAYLRRMLQRHYLAAGPMASYMAKFAHPLDVRLPTAKHR